MLLLLVINKKQQLSLILKKALLISAIIFQLSFASSGFGQEICDDGIDNDNNGLIDCLDTAACGNYFLCNKNVATNLCPNTGIHIKFTDQEVDCVANVIKNNVGCYDHICYDKNNPTYINDVKMSYSPDYDPTLCQKCLDVIPKVCGQYGSIGVHLSATSCSNFLKARYNDPIILPSCNITGDTNGTFTDEEYQCVLSHIGMADCKQSVCWDSNQGIYTDRNKYIDNKDYDATKCEECKKIVPMHCAEFGADGFNVEATNCNKMVNSFLNYIQVTKDTDGDGVYDHLDNCISVKNTNQLDSNNNGIGDLCEPGGAEDCDTTNFSEKNTCDMVTSDEKQALAADFNSVNVELTVPNFTFKSNTTNTNRNCSIGKIKTGNTLLVDCSSITQQDSNYMLCERGCKMVPDDNCLYHMNILMPPGLIKSIANNEPSIQDFFDNPDTEINLNVEISIDSDYLASSPGKYNQNIDTTSAYATTKNICNAVLFVKKERVILSNVDCKLMVGTTSYDNILNLQDYLKAIANDTLNCK